MKIYVSHASSYDFRNELYAPLKHALKDPELFLPHENSDSANKDTMEILVSCDIVIAEVSYPSTGQGIELGWANMLHKPIVCIYKSGTRPSSAIPLIATSMQAYTFIERSWLDTLIENLSLSDT